MSSGRSRTPIPAHILRDQELYWNLLALIKNIFQLHHKRCLKLSACLLKNLKQAHLALHVKVKRFIDSFPDLSSHSRENECRKILICLNENEVSNWKGNWRSKTLSSFFKCFLSEQIFAFHPHLRRSGRDVRLLATSLYVLVLFNLMFIRNCYHFTVLLKSELRQTSLRLRRTSALLSTC